MVLACSLKLCFFLLVHAVAQDPIAPAPVKKVVKAKAAASVAEDQVCACVFGEIHDLGTHTSGLPGPQPHRFWL
jgi:hypothetical protein